MLAHDAASDTGELNQCVDRYSQGGPCGYYCDARKECTCTNSATRYQKKLSGPLLDRIDIHVGVPRVDYEKLADNRTGETPVRVRAQVEAAREQQKARFAHRSNDGADT